MNFKGYNNINKLVCSMLALCFHFSIKSQITSNNTLSPQQMVQNVLIGGGINVSNISFTGDSAQIAQFIAAPGTNLGLLNGIILSTGNALTSSIYGPQGPNDSPYNSSDFENPGDTDISALAGTVPTGSHDAAVLEFDFIPTSDSIKLRYCFGSEEYPSFVGFGTNDAFGFFITGPNPSGGAYTSKNIALIPGTSSPVTIDNVNAGLNSIYYINNGSSVVNCEFNGLTKVFYALEKVSCGETYHIKLVIADVGDYLYDSAVFIEAWSFKSAKALDVNVVNSNSVIQDSVLLEDCNSYCVNFIRKGNVAFADSFDLQISGNALLGTDYIQQGNPSFVWPTKLIFAPGQDTIKICNIKALQDGFIEGIDTVKFILTEYITSIQSCVGPNPINFNLFIKDYNPISIGQNDFSMCKGSSGVINVLATQGLPAYTYTISPSSVHTATLNTGPLFNPITYTIAVNDICNKIVVKTISVTILPTPTLTTSAATVCTGQTATLTATGATSYTWSNGSVGQNVFVIPSSTMYYYVTGTLGTCTNIASCKVTVISQNITITGSNHICIGQSAQLTANGGSSYLWNTGTTNPVVNVTPTITTTYTVSSFISNCTNTAVYSISVSPVPTLTITGAPMCYGESCTIQASGSLTYSWSTGALSSSIQVSPAQNTTYIVTGFTAPGCSYSTQYTQIVIKSYPKITDIGVINICLDSVKSVEVSIKDGLLPYATSWLIPFNGIVPFDTINNMYFFSPGGVPSNETYTVVVKDKCNKLTSELVNIVVFDCSITIPNVISANGDGVNDIFRIKGLENYSNNVLRVYDRWGKKVYSSDNYMNDWNPEPNSTTYFYILELENGKKYNGFIEVYGN